MPLHSKEKLSSNFVIELQQINTNNQADVYDENRSRSESIHFPTKTCHQIGQDSWFQVGFVMTTGLNGAYVLGFSGAIMVPLGWTGGVVGLMLAAAYSLYVGVLIAKLHECGGKRHIRYRDLAGHIYGRKMYMFTWVLQYVNLFMINTGFIILAGQAIKAVYVLFRDDGVLKLSYCIVIAGFICAVFAMSVPHLSALRIWLGFSTFFSLAYISIGMALSVKYGLEAPPRDYSVPNSGYVKVFQTIGAAANLVIAFNTVMLPEIQATVRQPAVGNMVKALYFMFSVSSLSLYAVTFIGYWAFGSSTSTYLLNSVHGPVWVMVIANISALLQAVIALHIFASPVYEFLDTRFGNIKGSVLSLHNLSFRIMVRGGYLAISTLVAALLPFIGDFMSLTGAVSVFPLAFILPNHMHLMVKGNKMGSFQKMWHWLNIFVFSIMSVAATVSAIKLIVADSKTFHLFADL